MNTTLITGASSGIGEAFARKLAARGHNLLLVARTEENLVMLCSELGRIRSIRAQYVAMDLSEPDAPARLLEETQQRDLQIDFLINNAGFGSMGDFAKLDLARELNMIDLNIRSLVELTHRFLQPMRERKSGRIINVASTAGFQGVPFMAALCPGVTETNFFEASRMQRPPARISQTPEEVVETALRAVKRGKSSVISGWTNFFMIETERLVPRSLILRAAGAVLRSHTEKG